MAKADNTNFKDNNERKTFEEQKLGDMKTMGNPMLDYQGKYLTKSDHQNQIGKDNEAGAINPIDQNR